MQFFISFFKNLISLPSENWQEYSTQKLTELTILKVDQYISLLIATLLVCIGLNTGSHLSIIGGLILFPIIGPFYAFGYSILSLNLSLLQLSIQTILIIVFFVLFTSYFYFWATPIYIAKNQILLHAHLSFSELFVAAIAGVAGFISIIKKKSQIIFIAVQIATAMIVPLCLTAYSATILDTSLIVNILSLFFLKAFFIVFGAIFISAIIGTKSLQSNKFQKILIQFLGIVVVSVGVFYSISLLKSSIVTLNVDSYLQEELINNHNHLGFLKKF